MMAMVKIVILLLVVFTATALENSHEIESNHELHPFSPPALSPSTDADEHNKTTIVCAIGCVVRCQDKKFWQKAFCIGFCLTQCSIGPSDSLSEIVCVVDCVQSSTNNLRIEANMMDDRISACTQQCKKDRTLMHE